VLSSLNVLNDLGVVGSVYGNNLSTQKAFTFNCNTPCNIGGSTFFRYDIDLTKYTIFITNVSGGTLRKFKFMSWLTSGAHNSGLYSLNYDIDYSFAQNLIPSTFNGLNALSYGFPTHNYNLNQVTSNGVFLWAHTFNILSFFSFKSGSFQAIIIDYL
jgi:hypothetical protein